MKLQMKLMINTMISLLMLLAVLVYVVLNVSGLQASNRQIIELMTESQQLKTELILSQLSLANASSNMTEANKTEALSRLHKADSRLTDMLGKVTIPSYRSMLDEAQDKFKSVSLEGSKALSDRNAAEIKRQSVRILGVLNVVHMLTVLSAEFQQSLTEQIDAKIRNVYVFSLIGGAALFLIAGLFNYITTWRIVQPIKRLSRHTNAIAAGQLFVSIEESRNKDEVGELTRAFATMMVNLRGIVGTAQQVGERVDRLSHELEKENAVLSDISKQIAVSTDEMASGGQAVAEDLQQAVSHMDELKRSFQINLEGSLQSGEYGEEAVVAIGRGTEAIETQRGIMEQNMKAIRRMEEAVRQLSDSIGDIRQMVGYVSEVASQTNLLALNAGIEAARAGEAGKGFAVVAQEVKKLSGQSSLTANRMMTILENVAGGIEQVVMTMQDNLEMTRLQEQAVSTTGDAFESIRGKVAQIAEQLRELTERMHDSVEKSEQVLRSVESISAVTEQSAAASEEISASTSEQLTAFLSIGDKVKVLREVSDKLSMTLEQFTLEETKSDKSPDDSATGGDGLTGHKGKKPPLRFARAASL
ncbi:methyl-accepting chemotaxis protein [Paenibacillus hamazuiensis]|uniref:methyl-accepting chemotaxis protein n=1 Tax=Paenibacillus hamazuiensis TaxID=2936508 RepID=UPI00200BD014|nr:methyl-accepting chemotaxis protein [Paenibacillus hamazuiensis]